MRFCINRGLLAVSCLSLPLLAGCSALGEYLATPEGQASAGQAASGAAAVVSNPLNPIGWVDIFMGGGALVAAAFGAKKAGQGVKALGKFAKQKLVNQEAPPEA